jgi:hypothetical protein
MLRVLVPVLASTRTTYCEHSRGLLRPFVLFERLDTVVQIVARLDRHRLAAFVAHLAVRLANMLAHARTREGRAKHALRAHAHGSGTRRHKAPGWLTNSRRALGRRLFAFVEATLRGGLTAGGEPCSSIGGSAGRSISQIAIVFECPQLTQHACVEHAYNLKTRQW